MFVCKMYLQSAISRECQALWVKTNVACSKELATSCMIPFCTCQLAHYKVLSMIRAPATRAKVAERAARLEQLGALLIRAFCFPARAHQGLGPPT